MLKIRRLEYGELDTQTNKCSKVIDLKWFILKHDGKSLKICKLLYSMSKATKHVSLERNHLKNGN